jgi:hypothetical protein
VSSVTSDVVQCIKITDRGDDYAAFCAHPVHGKAWVRVRPTLKPFFTEGSSVEIKWQRTQDGIVEATNASDPPSVREALRKSEIPFG